MTPMQALALVEALRIRLAYNTPTNKSPSVMALTVF